MKESVLHIPEGQTYRNPSPGMGLGVLERTYAREVAPGVMENWGDIATRVAAGNISLDAKGPVTAVVAEYESLRRHLARASVLLSGRHLQHGDGDQWKKNQELLTNCSTSATSFALFYLLLNGCFRTGTPVRMADGSYKSIEEVEEGDSVISYDENDGVFKPQEVLAVHSNQPKPMVRVTMEDGSEVVCTYDHKFLTTQGDWVAARDLDGRDVVSFG